MSRRNPMSIGQLVIGLVYYPFIIVFCILAVQVAAHAVSEYLDRASFDSAAWQDPVQINDDIRNRMIDSLLDRHDFRGMTRGEVVAILGEPSGIGDPDGTWFARNWEMFYWLGGSGNALAFRLDANSKVVDYEVLLD